MMTMDLDSLELGLSRSSDETGDTIEEVQFLEIYMATWNFGNSNPSFLFTNPLLGYTRARNYL